VLIEIGTAQVCWIPPVLDAKWDHTKVGPTQVITPTQRVQIGLCNGCHTVAATRNSTSFIDRRIETRKHLSLTAIEKANLS
jgi:hypothetical protein